MIALSLTNETKNAMCVTTARGEIVAVTDKKKKENDFTEMPKHADTFNNESI